MLELSLCGLFGGVFQLISSLNVPPLIELLCFKHEFLSIHYLRLSFKSGIVHSHLGSQPFSVIICILLLLTEFYRPLLFQVADTSDTGWMFGDTDLADNGVHTVA